MLARIRAFFAPNLGKVLGQFEKVLLKLDKVIAHETERERTGNSLVVAGNSMVASAQATRTRATTVKTNIKNMLGE